MIFSVPRLLLYLSSYTRENEDFTSTLSSPSTPWCMVPGTTLNCALFSSKTIRLRSGPGYDLKLPGSCSLRPHARHLVDSNQHSGNLYTPLHPLGLSLVPLTNLVYSTCHKMQVPRLRTNHPLSPHFLTVDRAPNTTTIDWRRCLASRGMRYLLEPCRNTIEPRTCLQRTCDYPWTRHAIENRQARPLYHQANVTTFQEVKDVPAIRPCRHWPRTDLPWSFCPLSTSVLIIPHSLSLCLHSG